MKQILCTFEEHAEAILDMFNHSILHSTALYEYQPRNIGRIQDWFRVKQENDFPVLGMSDSNGQLAGFASYGSFRPYPANKYTVEHSIYVHADFQGQGIASQLMQALIEKAVKQEFHCMIGGIDATNTASIKLHEKFGFQHSGTLKQVGYKFGEWLDLAFYQLILETPVQPVES